MTSTPTALVCREVFDENSQPSAEEISEYALQIGIDPVTESHLLPLARDGLMQALPAPWKAYYDDKLKTHYFYNSDTKVTQWDHPLDQVYKNLVIKAKLSSERGDSILDDTCVSIQDLVTYEEDARCLTTDKSDPKEKMEGQDSSLETSLEEEVGSDKKGKIPPPELFASKSGLAKSGFLNPIGKKPLPPVGSLSDRRLMQVKGFMKNPGHSNTFPRTAQTSAPKFKSVMFQDDVDSFDNSDSDQSYEKKQSIENKWTVPSFGNNNRVIKHTPEIIDLSFNPRELNDNSYKDDSANFMKPKKGLSLSGGGSVFLKSNRNPTQQNDASDGKLVSQGSDNPKGILRERSFLESTFKIPGPEGIKIDNYNASEEDRKIVRFNLEKKEEEFQYDYSPSPSSNSCSDVLHGNQGSVIDVNKVEGENNISPRSLVRRNSDIPVLNTEAPGFINGRKLRPLKSDDNIKVDNSVIQGSNKNSEFISTEENRLPNDGISNSPTRKLIKPLPGDFLKPSLFQKPFQKLSDIIKPTSPDTDSESDYTGIKGTKPLTQKNKLSINLMESVDSEASVESPDKESKSMDEPRSPKSYNNSQTSDKLTKEKFLNKRMDSLELRRNSLNRSSMVAKDHPADVSRNVINMDEEMSMRRDKEIREMRLKLDMELKDVRTRMEEKHKAELTALKVQLDNEHIKNKAEIQKLLQETRENHKKILQKTVENLAVEFENRKEEEIEIEKDKLSATFLKDVEELTKNHRLEIERLKQENKSNLQKIFTNLEHENMKAINELSMQFADNLEVEKIRLNTDNKTVLDKMRSEHEAMCDELKKDYRSEVDLLRSQQAAHLSALRDRLRREREHPSSVISPPPQSTPLSPRDEVAFEKLRCDKRLLEDKYRCLKEKYARLKNDVKISIERRNKRREQSQTTGSETDKSHSHKNGGVIDKSAEGQDPRKRILSNNNNSVNGDFKNSADIAVIHSKPPIPDNNNPHSIHISHHKDVNLSLSDSTPQHNNSSSLNSHLLNVANKNDRGVSPDYSRVKSPSFRNKSPLGKVVFRSEKNYCDNDNSIGANDISLSQSDSHTVSNGKHGKKVHLVEHHREKQKDSGEQRNKGVLRKSFKPSSEYVETTVTDYQDSSDTGISDHVVQVRESLIGRSRKKLFTRLKSASTSRLNYTVSSKVIDHTCNPIENLRQQLRKLEELEEQFPDVTLNADTTAYRLRYPFPESGGGGELGFLRHRALVEREGVRRAKAALRRRSDSLKQRRRTPQPWQDECELTDMEVSLHRTRSIIGEKVIRLRHIDKTLRRMQSEREDKEEHVTETTSPKQRDENKQDTTLSDISSHSSGFSSTDMAHSAEGGRERDRDDAANIISSLQTLNTEIQDIWQVLNTQQQINIAKVFPLGQLLYTDMGWQFPLVTGNLVNYQSPPSNSVTVTIPAIGGATQDANQTQFRLNSFRQMAHPIRPQQNIPTVHESIPSGVATTLVERTRDLRDWLKQQAAL